MQARLHRWRLSLASGRVCEEHLSDSVTEFGMIIACYAGGRYRYTYAATGKPSWFLFDGWSSTTWRPAPNSVRIP